MLSEEYPAPVCGDCDSPMWTRKRLRRVQATYEEDSACFECRFCHTMLTIRRGDKPFTERYPE
jgi:hypothetical protein